MLCGHTKRKLITVTAHMFVHAACHAFSECVPRFLIFRSCISSTGYPSLHHLRKDLNCVRKCIVPYDVSHLTAASSAVYRRCRSRSSLVLGQVSTICDIIWMSPQSHISLSVGPHFFDMCCSGPVVSGNGLAMTSGIGDDEKREVGIKQLH